MELIKHMSEESKLSFVSKCTSKYEQLFPEWRICRYDFVILLSYAKATDSARTTWITVLRVDFIMNGSDSSSEQTVSTGRIIITYQGSDLYLIWDPVLVFAWRDWVRSRKFIPVSQGNRVPADIQNASFQIRIKKFTLWSNLLSNS
jgi:hypothetical protein